MILLGNVWYTPQLRPIDEANAGDFWLYPLNLLMMEVIPAIDAVCTLYFMGAYRRMAVAMWKRLKETKVRPIKNSNGNNNAANNTNRQQTTAV